MRMMKKLLTLSLLLMFTAVVFGQWVQQATGFTAPSRGINYVSVVDENVVWAAAYDGSGTAAAIQEFTRTTNGGTTWTPGVINNATGLEMAMIFALNADTAFAPLYRSSGSNPQGIYVTYDGGLTCTRQTTASVSASASFPQTNIPAPLSGEWGILGFYDAVGDTIWWGTQKGRVFMSTDKGYNWSVAQTPLNTYTTVVMASGMHGLAQDKGASSTGTLYETVDGGTTWTLVPFTGNCFTNDIAHVPGTASTFVTTGAATGFSGASYSYDGGYTWTDFVGTLGTQFLSTDWANNANGWAGGFNDQVMPTTVGGMFKYTGVLTQVMENLEKDKGVVVYPNPSSSNFTFSLKGFENEDLVLNIRDLSGRLVFSGNYSESPITFNIDVNLSEVPSGFYIAELQSGDFRWTEKLVKN